jgi:hypothetical protein
MRKYLVIALIWFYSNALLAQTLGARAAGLGSSAISLVDAYSAYNNPGTLGFITQTSTGFYYENRFLIKQLAFSGFSMATPLKKGSIGLSYTSFGYNAFRQSLSGVSYGIALNENISIGTKINFLSLRIGDVYGKAIAFTGELGFLAKLSQKVWVAGHINNPTKSKFTNYNNEIIPSTLCLGIQYLISKNVIALLEAEKGSYQKLNIKGGIEYKPSKEIFLRAGASSNPAQASFGVGVQLKMLQFDLSSSYHYILGFTPQVGLTHTFGKTRSKSSHVSDDVEKP